MKDIEFPKFKFTFPIFTIVGGWLTRPVLKGEELLINTMKAIRDKRYIGMKIIDVNGNYAEISNVTPGPKIGRTLFLKSEYVMDFDYETPIKHIEINEAKEILINALNSKPDFWKKCSLYDSFNLIFLNGNSISGMIDEFVDITRNRYK